MKDLFVKPPVKEGVAEQTAEKSGNAFLNASTKKDTTTWNGAISNSSTGDAFVDDFANSGAYRNRATDVVFASASALFAINPTLAMKMFLYQRLITRKIKGFFASTVVQRGQGNKDESLRRLLWVAYNYPETFYKNLWLVPLVGTWKDLWTLLGIDFQNALDKEKFFELMTKGLTNPDMQSLVVKYMPQIKSESKCTTNRAKKLNSLAKEFAKFMSMSYPEYRKFKTKNGKAHVWQMQISKGFYDEINFSLIPGKALNMLVNSKFLQTHNLLNKYTEWIKAQPVAKFTGYVYELFKQVNPQNPLYKKLTIDKQFDGLVALAKQDNGALHGNIWCALDTSSSMSLEIVKGLTCYDVCISLGIYFSALNEGAFKDNVIMFDERSRKLVLKGTFSEKASQIKATSTAWGSTNFQSVIDEIVRIRENNPQIPISDYPETLLVVSDMQFNPSGSWRYTNDTAIEQTNYEAAMAKLKAVGLPDITVIWWQVSGNTSDFPSTLDDKKTYFLSGFDGSIISLLLGGKEKEKEQLSMKELMEKTLNQEVLVLVE